MARQPVAFFLKGAAALTALLLLTLIMESRPEVWALRAMMLLGLAIVALKLVLRRFNVDWPSRTHHRHVTPSRRPD